MGNCEAKLIRRDPRSSMLRRRHADHSIDQGSSLPITLPLGKMLHVSGFRIPWRWAFARRLLAPAISVAAKPDLAAAIIEDEEALLGYALPKAFRFNLDQHSFFKVLSCSKEGFTVDPALMVFEDILRREGMSADKLQLAAVESAFRFRKFNALSWPPY